MPAPTDPPRYLGRLVAVAATSLPIYAAIAWLSRQFIYGQGHRDRPIVLVLVLFGAAFVLYVMAQYNALKCSDDRRLVRRIVLAAVAFRAVLLFSQPIQELDIYRYIWDGATTAAGVSPFRYSPAQVQQTASGDAITRDLSRLVALRDRDPSLATILTRVHYPELPTIYPPVSQAVFAAAALATPTHTSVSNRIVLMKAWLVAFDLATLGLLIVLLRTCGRHVGWAVSYGWCPLVIKEFANSGHLDSIAVFLTMLALVIAVRRLADRASVTSHGGTITRVVVSAVVLSLAIGAKLYPIVLALLFAGLWYRLAARGMGWRSGLAAAVGGSIVLTCLTALLLLPMAPRSRPEVVAASPAPEIPIPLPPDAPEVAQSQQQDPSLALKTFLRRWEMNDFLFLLVIENVRPPHTVPPEKRAWFSLLPERYRKLAWRGFFGCFLSVPGLSERVPIAPADVPFLLARALTAAVFLIVALALSIVACRRGAEQPCAADGSGSAADKGEDARDVPRGVPGRLQVTEPEVWLRAAFLTLAWFLLLSPTQNPWYWTWALPLLPFARGRAWWAVSGLLFVYYLRFWLLYHYPHSTVFSTRYAGAEFFDLVVTWLEFAPWFLWLTGEAVWRRMRHSVGTPEAA